MLRSTHLDHAALPGVDGGFALEAEEVGLALCELEAKDLCVALDELRGGGGWCLR